MKVIVENLPSGDRDFFIVILNSIINAKDQNDMRNRIKLIFNFFEQSDDYIYGFGGSHMWVSNSDNKKRVLFVELN
jgi:hypothetical protein